MSSHVVKDSISIMLIGKSGVGKTATSKLILDRKRLARENDTYSKTTTPETNVSYFKGREITVVDTPGFGDIKLKHKYVVEKTIKDIERAVAINPNPEGFNAIIFVVRFGVEFTTEDVNSITILKHIFGKYFVQNHGILLFTGGDAFVEDTSVSDKSRNFKVWLESQTENNLNFFLQEFDFRAILFNNATNEKSGQDIQTKGLIEIIDSLTVKGNRYTTNIFQNAQHARQRLLTALNTEYIKDENLDKINDITEKLGQIKIDHLNYEEMLLCLKKVESEADLFYVSLTEDEEHSEQLKAAKNATECLIKLIKTQLDTIDCKKFKAVKKQEHIEVKKSYSEVLKQESEIKLQKKKEQEGRIRRIEEENAKKEEQEKIHREKEQNQKRERERLRQLELKRQEKIRVQQIREWEARRKRQEEEDEKRREEEEDEIRRQEEEDERRWQEDEDDTRWQEEEDERIGQEEEDERRRQDEDDERMRQEEEDERIRREEEDERRRQVEEDERIRQEEEDERIMQEEEDERIRQEEEDERIRQEEEDERIRQDEEDERIRQEEEDERIRQDEEDERIRQEEEDERIRQEEEDEISWLDEED